MPFPQAFFRFFVKNRQKRSKKAMQHKGFPQFPQSFPQGMGKMWKNPKAEKSRKFQGSFAHFPSLQGRSRVGFYLPFIKIMKKVELFLKKVLQCQKKCAILCYSRVYSRVGSGFFEDPLLIFEFFKKEKARGLDMKKNSKGVVGAVARIAEPLVESLGYFLWDVEYVKEGADMYLRITIDSEEGITIEDCEKVHRAIDPLLDEADPIEEAYHLEISSPGIERELKNEMQIGACVDWDVEVRLYAPMDGAKSFRGTLLGLTEQGEIAIALPDGTEKIFARASVASLRTYYVFD